MSAHRRFNVSLANGETLALGPTPVVMGILNLTPDSFSDGGDHIGTQAANAQARSIIAQGAAIIDVGGESTRPGAEELSAQNELDRVIPVLEAMQHEKIDALVSIDTYKALIADQAIQTGANIINDVHGLQRDPEIADVAALHNAPIIIMHWDDKRDTAKDILAEMARYFETSLSIASRAGLPDEQIILDPGFGFGKDYAENYDLLKRLHELCDLGFPILSGTSRKSMLGKLLDVPPKQRGAGTIASNVFAYQNGAHIFRVHDVRENVDALRVTEATIYGPPE